MKRIMQTIFVVALVILVGCTNRETEVKKTPYSSDFELMQWFNILVAENTYIGHALGGLDGNTHINSIDALTVHYGKGQRIFEVDVNFTSDDKLVLIHGWTKADYEKRLNVPFDKKKPIMDYETFMNSKIHLYYTANSFKDLVDFMKIHEDMFVMIDYKNHSYKDTKKAYEAIVVDANYDDFILQRLIVVAHTPDMVNAAKEVYDFQNINMYLADDDKRKGVLAELSSFIDYCHENQITSFSTSVKIYNANIASKMKESGLFAFVFTTDDEDVSKILLEMGADMVGTNFLEE